MRKLLPLMALPLLMLSLAACEQKGPAERAGERVDRAAQGVRDAVDPPRGPVERAGRALDRATQ